MPRNDGNEIIQAYCTVGTLNFTKYFFKSLKKKKFIVAQYHKLICETLDAVIDGRLKKVIFNVAPRYAKTELVVKNFIAYGFALNPSSNFIHLSYSDDLALDNSEEIRDIVKSSEYRSIFPYVQVKKDTDSKKKWVTTEGGGLYATSMGGQVTGFGAGTVDEEGAENLVSVDDELELGNNIDMITSGNDRETFSGAMIIDDPIKPDEATNDTAREKVNKKFETTIRNRVNSRNTPIIIVMQRLHENDLCGYLMALEPGEWTVISLPCLFTDESGDEKALWPFKHTVQELHKLREKDPYVFDTQYMQNPKPVEGLMYHEFRTYEVIPYNNVSKRKNYTDTADTGSDFLCSICYVEQPDYNYVTDILFTKKPMEYTEPKTAEMIAKNETEEVVVESNNGGRGFRRNVESQLLQMRYTKAWFQDHTQTANKNVRIFTNSASVNSTTLFPAGWERRWPEFYKQLTSYRKEGGNPHDDAPDCLTGTFEFRNQVYSTEEVDKDDLGIY